MTRAPASFLARVKVWRRKTMKTQTQKMKSVKYKNKKGKRMRTEERGKFSGVQRGLSIDANELHTSLREVFRDMLHEGYEKGLGKGRADAHELRTSLRELFGDMLQKGYEKGLGKGRAPGFVAGYHKGWSDAHFWYQVARRDGGHQMPRGIGDALQHSEVFFQGKFSVSSQKRVATQLHPASEERGQD